AAGSPKEEGDDQAECKLLGSFAIFVQLALGGLALLSLVYKRWRERPQRPVKIWFFDVSKQVFGSVLVHMANVFMSMLTSGRISVQVEPAAVSAAVAASAVLRRFADAGGPGGGDDGPYVPNPCSFYLLNLAIDTTLGIPILIFLLRIFTALVSYTPLGQPPESIQSGHYGNPPKAWWWLKQSLIYFLGLFGMKFCVLVIFLMFPWISRVGDWALRWTEGNEKIQIIFVMMLFPLIMNALQYYIIDSFIKKAATKEDTDGHSAAGSEGEGYQRVRTDEDHVEGHGPQRGPSAAAEEEADEDKKGGIRSQAKITTSPAHEEYDPEVDGDRTAATGGSSSTTAEGTVSSELYPKE
ncbi:hypothetical protein M406DRAFT_240717, partial [Cryphonectria parasitica EP155]